MTIPFVILLSEISPQYIQPKKDGQIACRSDINGRHSSKLANPPDDEMVRLEVNLSQKEQILIVSDK